MAVVNSVRFEYKSVSLNDDLTDVKITVKNESGTVKVSNQSMTHAANGVYYYDYTVENDGYYYALMSSITENKTIPQTKYGTTNVVSDGSAQFDLCTVNDVLRITRFTTELTSTQIGEFIEDAEDEIYGVHGKPLRKIYTYIQSSHYSYWLGETKIYIIQRVEISNTGAEGVGSVVVSGSYTGSLVDGFITFDGVGQEWVDDHEGERVDVEYVPQIFHDLAQNLASQYILEISPTVSRGTGTMANPRLARVRERIKRIELKLASRLGVGVLRTSKYKNWDRRQSDFISQDFYNIY